jgi:hypothetical protein
VGRRAGRGAAVFFFAGAATSAGGASGFAAGEPNRLARRLWRVGAFILALPAFALDAGLSALVFAVGFFVSFFSAMN